MSDLNSSDLNDLFKKAAENYPLRTDSADWEKIARALDEEDRDAGAVPEFAGESGRTRTRSPLLLLLLPFLVVGYFMFHNSGSNGKTADHITKETSPVMRGLQHNPVSEKTENSYSDSVSNLRKSAGAPAAATKSAILSDNKNRPSSNVKSLTAKSQLTVPNASPETRAVTNPKAAFSKRYRNGRKKNIVSRYTDRKHTDRIRSNKSLTETSSASDETNFAEPNQAATAVQTDKHTFGLPGLWALSAEDKNKRAGFIKKPSAARADSNSIVKQKKRSSTAHYFYAGVLVAPDISTVKFQSVKCAGVTGGILLGYHFSRRFSVESGAYLDIKKYYSKGEYFSTKNVSNLNGVDLLNVNGNCSMIEVPVNIRYDMTTGNKHTFFATAGLSTYFMFHQSYSYEYYVSGWTGNNTYSYVKGMQNWFSIVNASIGYEHELGKIGKLRIEPYLRIPMSGMGTGSLPILSSGLNLGLIRKF